MELLFAVKSGSKKVFEHESRCRGAVVRFWGCNLKCPLCFAQSYAFRNEKTSRQKIKISTEEFTNLILQELKSLNLPKLQWIRLEGGEPLTSETHIEAVSKVIESLGKVCKRTKTSYIIIVQTNGVSLGNYEFAKTFYETVTLTLKSSECFGKIRVAVEISFKGANKKACELYSGARKTFKYQFDAFKNSLRILQPYWKDGFKDVAVYPVAGFGSSIKDEDDKDLVLIPLDPEALEREVEVPLFHENTWSTSFSKVKEMFLDVISKHRDVYKKYVETHERRIHMYGLELRGRKWQLSWISRAFKDENLRNFVRTYLRLNKHTINFAGLL